MVSNTGSARPRIGIFVPQFLPWDDYLAHALQIESLGFDSLWLADHFVSPYDAALDWYECWTILAAIAARTLRIRLGTGVTHTVYRNPAILARAAMTVDRISNGRLDLGMGVGSAGTHNTAIVRNPPATARARVDHYAESVALIDQLLCNEKTTFEGRYYQVTDATIKPGPVQQPRPPFNLAGHHTRTLKIAAAYGQAWNSFYPGENLTPEQSSQATKERGEQLDQYALEAGRDPAQIGRTYFVGYSSDQPFASEEALIDFIGRYQEAGIDEFVFGYVPGLEDNDFDGSWIMDEARLHYLAGELLPG
jgi:alkanesulfonate monooxygenase SsuD/methylene tetrahydromethanopterin reductase-like flavin-dependent oxidoreductase (luciferase family)